MNVPILKESGIVNVTFGENVTIVKPVNIYGCDIGKNSFVGPFVEIQKGVKIGENCRIQSHAFICEKVTMGNNCFISHGAKFINDKFLNNGPSGNNQALWGETILGDNVSIGTNATILPVSIVSGTVIGAGAVVTKDITVKGYYVGNPAVLLRKI